MSKGSVQLKEIIDAANFKKKDYEELIKMVMEISSKDKDEPTNSATFSLAIDVMERNGKLYVVKNIKPSYEEVPETVEII